MSKNRNVRNAKAIRKNIKGVPFKRSGMKAGQVYRHSGWLFCKRADGSLGTDVGLGFEKLKRDIMFGDEDHSHWFNNNGRFLKPVYGVTIPV